jgi:outer membrane protein TolC
VVAVLAMSSGCSAVNSRFPIVNTTRPAPAAPTAQSVTQQDRLPEHSNNSVPEFGRPPHADREQAESHRVAWPTPPLPGPVNASPGSPSLRRHALASYVEPVVTPHGTSPIQQTGRVVPPAPGLLSTAGAFAMDVDQNVTGENRHQLDLSTALELVAGQNPQVAFAHQRIAEAEAQWEAAEALWLPSIRAGMSLHRHEGNLQASNGTVVDVSRSSVQTGFGARAVGAGTTPVPGLSTEFHVRDAIYQPLIAERLLSARNFGSWVTYNDALLRAAESYVELQRAHQSKAIAVDTLRRAEELARLTASFARAGQGAQSDADRSAAELAIRTNDVARADEAMAVASARLAEVLHLDALSVIVPKESQVTPIKLVSLDASVQKMVAAGLLGRPELAESRELVEAACERLQREISAPLVPSVLLGLSYGGFGGGEGDTVDGYDERFDFDIAAVWEIRNLGWGESAARDAARARVEQARYLEIQIMDRVSREVVESRAQVRSRHQQIATAKTAIAAAEQSYIRDRKRINQGQGLPLESLQSVQALDRAQREYLRTIVDFNLAQFRLHHALGWPTDATWSH